MTDTEAKLKAVEATFGVELRDHQAEALRALAKGDNVILHSPTGCHARGQGILTFDGSVRRIEEIEVGDQLMGPDSEPRTVLKLIRGHGPLHRVLPTKGSPFVVNTDHVLTLVRTNQTPIRTTLKKRGGGQPNLGGRVIDVPLGEWLTWSKTQKHLHKLFRVPVEFPICAGYRPVDPYFLGVLLGDGSMTGSASPSVTSADAEIAAVALQEAHQRGLALRVYKKPNNRASGYYITSGVETRCGRRGGANSLTLDLRALDLWGKTAETKFVPFDYKTASRAERLELIAGLIDTDGSLQHGFDYISKSPILANDLAFMARSVGLAAYVTPCEKADQNGTIGHYFRVSVSGDLSIVPCRVKHKQAEARRQIKNVLRTGFTVEPVGDGDFYGFTLDGDGRYLLDDFTVTHNSGKSLVFQGASHVLPDPGVTVILYPLRSLVKDQTKRAEELGLPSVTLYGDTKVKDRPAVYAKLQSGEATMLLTTPESFDRNRKMQAVLKDRVSLLVVDEAHAYEEWADGFRPTYRNAGRIADLVGVKQILLCSATLTNEGFRTAKATLHRTNWSIVQVPAVRPNLIYENLSYHADEILERAICGKGLAAPGICFFTTVKELQGAADAMKNRTGKKVLTYHGALTPKLRRETQEQFMDGKEWVFATKAFGMGIDKADIRSIVHYQLPSSILSYAQECVHGSTPVRTGSGNRPASEIRVGDLVTGYDQKTKLPVQAAVTEVLSGQTDRWIAVRTSAGDEVLTTPNHPFMVNDVEVRADQLKVGDHVLTLTDSADTENPRFVADCLDADKTFAVVDPTLIDEFRKKLPPSTLGALFSLKRAYDYTAYKRGKAAKLSSLQAAADASGVTRRSLYEKISVFKSHSGNPVTLPLLINDADLGWFAGITATDGYVFRSDTCGFGSWQVKLTNTNQKIIDKFVRIVKSFGLNCHVFVKNVGKNGLSVLPAYSAEVSSPVLCDLLDNFGIHAGRKSLTVACSNTVLEAGLAFKAGFIAGVIDGDGNLSDPRPGKPQGTVRFHTGSWAFASSFSRLLKSVGILTRISIEDYAHNAHIMTCGSDHGYSGEIGRFQSLRRLADLVEPLLVKRMFNVKTTSTDAREVVEATTSSRVIEIRSIDLDTPEPTFNWRVEPHHLLWTADTLTHNCGRAGRDGEESLCLLTQHEFGESAQFLLEQSVPTPQNVHRVWKELISLSRRYGEDEFFDVDWDEISQRTRLWPQTIQGCVSWLFTGKMITRKEKQKNWSVHLFANSEDRALGVPRQKALEIVEAIRSEAMIEGDGTVEFKPEELEEIVGGFVQDWKKKLNDLAEKGVLEVAAPPKGKAKFKFLHHEFKFAEGKDQLERARQKALDRLAGIRRLQRAHPEERRAMIEDAISLKLEEFDDGDEVEVKGATTEVRRAEPDSADDDADLPF